MRTATHHLRFGLALLLAACSLVSAETPPLMPVDRALDLLATYDDDQPRAPLTALELHAARVTGNPAGRRALADRLVSLLRAPATTLAAKRFICQLLESVGDESDAGVLGELLRSQETAEMARRALTAIPGDRSLAILRAALTQARGSLRLGLIDSLGRRRDAKSIDALAQLATGGDASTAAAAVNALGVIGSLASLNALRQLGARPALETRVQEAILRCAEQLVAEGESRSAAECFQDVWVTSKSLPLRMGALTGLVETLSRQALPQLMAAARELQDALRRHAFNLCNRLPGAEMTTALTQSLPELSPEARTDALTALARRGDRSAVTAVVQWLKDSEPSVRHAAITAVGALGGAEQLAALMAIAASPGEDQALARDALIAMTADGVDARLLSLVRTAQPQVQVQAIQLLEARRPKDTRGLASALKSDKVDVRLAAAHALGVLGNGDDWPALLDALMSASSGRERTAIASAADALLLRMGGGSEHARSILARLDNASPSCAAALLPLLATCGGEEALAATRTRLGSKEDSVRRAAIEALSRWADASAAGALLDVARESANDVDRALALRAYLRLSLETSGGGGDMLAAARELITDRPSKLLFVSALAKTPSTTSLLGALDWVRDEAVDAEAALAAIQIARALLKVQPLAAAQAMAETASRTRNAASKKSALDVRRQALRQAVSPAIRQAALKPDQARSALRRRELQRNPPQGFHLSAYLDLGPDDHARSGDVRLRLITGKSYVWTSGQASVDQLRALTIAFANNDVTVEATGLASDHRYRLGFTWWDFDHDTRRQSVSLIVGGRRTPLVKAVSLPSATRKQPPQSQTVDLPQDQTGRGSVRIAFERAGGVNAVVSEVWLWESDGTSPAPETKALPSKPGAPLLLVTGVDLHDWRTTTPVLVEHLERGNRLAVDVVEDPNILASPEIRSYKALVMHWMNWKVPAPGPAARNNLTEYVRQGGGLVFVHFACGAFQEWPDFVLLAGRVWNPKLRGHDPRGPFRVHIVDHEHPITRGMDDFDTDDELYTCLDGTPAIHVLAQARSKVDGRDYPMAFVHQFGKGRVFHCVLGHDARALRPEAVGDLYRRGALWAAKTDPQQPQ